MRAIVFSIALLTALVQASAAFAHASLVRAEPADGALVAEPPAALRLTFNEPVTPLVIRLIAPDGTTTTPEATTENTTVTVKPGPLRRGTHVLSWRVISADGHPVGGSLVFSVGEASGCGGGDYVLTILVGGSEPQVIEDSVAESETDTHVFQVG